MSDLFLEWVAGEGDGPGTGWKKARHLCLQPEHDSRGRFQMPRSQVTHGREASSSGSQQTVGTDQVPQRYITCKCTSASVCAGHISQMENSRQPPPWRELKTHLAAVLPRQCKPSLGERGHPGWTLALLKAACQAREYRRQKPEELGPQGVSTGASRTVTGKKEALDCWGKCAGRLAQLCR